MYSCSMPPRVIESKWVSHIKLIYLLAAHLAVLKPWTAACCSQLFKTKKTKKTKQIIQSRARSSSIPSGGETEILTNR